MTTRYDNDPRVTVHGPNGNTGYTVDQNGVIFSVVHTDTFGWMICNGLDMQIATIRGLGQAINFDSADDAIAVLIGDPQ